MMNRAAAAMVTLEMRSDELARFLVATIGTSSHSTDAIARSFALRDPAVLLVRMFACCLSACLLACKRRLCRAIGIAPALLGLSCCRVGSQRLLGRAMESDRKLRQRVLEVIHKITITEFDLQLPTLLQVLPEPNVRLDPVL